MTHLTGGLALVAVLSACGSTPSRTTTVHGMVGGFALDTPTAINVGGAEAFIGDIPNFCAAMGVTQTPRNATILFMTWTRTDADGHVPSLPVTGAPGSYRIVSIAQIGAGVAPLGSGVGPNEDVAIAWFQRDDASCNDIGQTGASSGTIELQVVHATGGTQGTFDLMFGADHLTGTFNAAECDTIGDATSCM